MRRDGRHPDAAGLERRENRRDRTRTACDPGAQELAVETDLVNILERGDNPFCITALAVDELDGHGISLELALELLRRPLDRDSSPADDREAVCQLIGLLQIVRREQDRQPLALGERV